MKALKLVTVTVLTLGAGLAGAQTPLDTIVGSAARRAASRDAVRSVAAACPDLSGTWEGTCSVAGTSSAKETIVVTQKGCESLQYGKESIVIGSLENRSVSSVENGKPTGTAIAFTYGWSKDGQALETHYQGLAKQLGTSEQVPLSGVGTTRIESGRLVISMNVAGLSIACSYDRK